MRQKFLITLAVCAVSLSGCAIESPTSEPSETLTTPSVQNESPEPVESGPSGMNSAEEQFVAAIESQIEGKEDSLQDELPAKKLTESYWLEKSKEYCEEIESGDMAMPRLQNVTEQQFESILKGTASYTLCPQK